MDLIKESNKCVKGSNAVILQWDLIVIGVVFPSTSIICHFAKFHEVRNLKNIEDSINGFILLLLFCFIALY